MGNYDGSWHKVARDVKCADQRYRQLCQKRDQVEAVYRLLVAEAQEAYERVRNARQTLGEEQYSDIVNGMEDYGD